MEERELSRISVEWVNVSLDQASCCCVVTLWVESSV